MPWNLVLENMGASINRGPKNRPKYIMVLNIGTTKMGPLIYGNLPHKYLLLESSGMMSSRGFDAQGTPVRLENKDFWSCPCSASSCFFGYQQLNSYIYI